MRIVSGLSEDGNTLTVKKFTGDLELPRIDGFEVNPENILIMYVDTETTGTNTLTDKITDLGYVIFEARREDGEILSIRKEFSALNDPGIPIPEEVSELTGITNEMVSGKSIPWEEVAFDIRKVNGLMAHFAKFDRTMLSQHLPEVRLKHWLCSVDLIDWKSMGHSGAKLEHLALEHGFFFKGHRALIDCQAPVKILTSGNYEGVNYLKLAMDNYRRERVHVVARGAQYYFKDELKAKGGRWDPVSSQWFFTLYRDSEKFEEICQFINDNDGAGNPNVISIPREHLYEEMDLMRLSHESSQKLGLESDLPDYKVKLGNFEGGKTHRLNLAQANRTSSFKVSCDETYSTRCPEGFKRTDLLCEPIVCKDYNMSAHENIKVRIANGSITYLCKPDGLAGKHVTCDQGWTGDDCKSRYCELSKKPTPPNPNCLVDCNCSGDSCRWVVCGCRGAPECK